MEEKDVYEDLFDKLIAENGDVDPGLMMREPALKYKSKVFAFYYAGENGMCFKLGKGYDIESHGIADSGFLSPFKNKPPMFAWFIVGVQHILLWEELTYVALAAMRN